MTKKSSKMGTKKSQEVGRKSSRQKRIWVTDEITRELTTEFNTSGTTILNALKFASYSAQAKSIREEAMKKMDEVVEANKELMQDFHL